MRLLVLPYPEIDPVALSLGPLSVKWYGLAYVAGLLLGWQYLRRLLSESRLWPQGRAPLQPALADDLFIWVAIGVVLGGRIGHVLLYEPGHFLSDPLEIVKVWRGGMAFHGGMLGTIVAMWLFARRRRVAPLSVMDLVAAAVPFGLFFGRIANFINAEVVGRESTVPWAMSFCNDAVRRYNFGQCPAGDVPRHPSQLYEAALEGLALFLLLRFLTHRQGALAQPGVVGGAFLAGYAGLRMLCELFKHDEYRGIFGNIPVTVGFVYCLPMLIAGLLLIAYARRTAPA
jgi:phosphatidylglycerol:prolipoprotein diacylglycerol transferase